MGDIPAPMSAPPVLTKEEEERRVLATADLDGIVRYISEKNPKNVIVMVGAGLSTSAGIPDFRTPGTGLYANLQRFNLPSPEDIFDIEYFQEHPDAFYALARDLWPTGKKYTPTISHFFVKLLQEQGRLLRCYTQNVDTLELLTGMEPRRVVAAHGNFATAHALNGKQVPIAELEEAIMAGPEACRDLAAKYGALVKPDIVFFGEPLPKRFVYGVGADFPCCDLLIVLGTSLTVAPFNQLVAKVPPRCPRVLINREVAGTHPHIIGGFKFGDADRRDVFLKGDIDLVIRNFCQRVGWLKSLEAMHAEGSVNAAVARAAEGVRLRARL